MLLKNKKNQQQVTTLFKVNQSVISRIKNNKSHKINKTK